MAEETKKETAKTTSTTKAKTSTAKSAAKSTPKKTSGKGNQKAKVISRIEKMYKDEVIPALMKEFNYTSIMQCPKLVKIVLNMRLGGEGTNGKVVEEATKQLTLIAGQKAVTTKAKKSIANFKLREKQVIGVKVTLRRLKMYDFYDKLVNIDLPRVRDFRGVNKNSFDGRGNYALGIKEQIIYPEIDYDHVSRNQGMDIMIVTSAKSDKEAYFLLEKLGMPFGK